MGYEPIGYEPALNNPESCVYRLEYEGLKIGRHPIVLIAKNGHVTYWDRDYAKDDPGKRAARNARVLERPLEDRDGPRPTRETWRPLGLHVG